MYLIEVLNFSVHFGTFQVLNCSNLFWNAPKQSSSLPAKLELHWNKIPGAKYKQTRKITWWATYWTSATLPLREAIWNALFRRPQTTQANTFLHRQKKKNQQPLRYQLMFELQRVSFHNELGLSLFISKYPNITRIHMYRNNPTKVFKYY